MAKKKPSKAKRKFRLGPVGQHFVIRWTETHARQRVCERLYPLGLDDAAIEGLIRSPLSNLRDQQDAELPDRIRRWSLTSGPCTDGKPHQLLFVFVVSKMSGENEPGEVIMITVIDKGPVHG